MTRKKTRQPNKTTTPDDVTLITVRNISGRNIFTGKAKIPADAVFEATEAFVIYMESRTPPSVERILETHAMDTNE